MSQQNESGIKTFTASGAIVQYTRVALDSSDGEVVAKAGAGVVGIGVAQVAAADGKPVAVKLWSPGKTYKVYADAAITEAAALYPDADGEFDDLATTGGPQIGLALEAALAAGDIIEMIYQPSDIAPARSSTSVSSAVGSIKLLGTTASTNTGLAALVIDTSGTIGFVPYWSAAAASA